MPQSDLSNQSLLRVGISSCLLGEEVRYDGGHQRNPYVTDVLSQYFEWVPVCPEVEFGLGTPRETIRLVQLEGDGARATAVALKTTDTDVDLTDRMQTFCQRRVKQLVKQDLDGFILKRGSPSCGVDRVKVFPAKGPPKRNGRGLFAEALLTELPNLPVEEEDRLSDARLRENWIERVFAYHAVKDLWRGGWELADLVAFHARYRMSLRSHDEAGCRELDRLVAAAKNCSKAELRRQYESGFMNWMRRVVATNEHAKESARRNHE